MDFDWDSTLRNHIDFIRLRTNELSALCLDPEPEVKFIMRASTVQSNTTKMDR